MEIPKGKETTPMEDRTDGTGKPAGSPRGVFPELCSPSPVRLTVWCKSLLFNGHGYTVFDDSDGRMVFRVDNYAHNWRQETVLMDQAGNVLLTIRWCRKGVSLPSRPGSVANALHQPNFSTIILHQALFRLASNSHPPPFSLTAVRKGTNSLVDGNSRV